MRKVEEVAATIADATEQHRLAAEADARKAKAEAAAKARRDARYGARKARW